jgi:cytochrome b pre-mRNA-processing protein 3
MIPPLFRRPKRTIAAVYGAIVAQARDPRFYKVFGVRDTVLGRFDLIVLHLAILLRRFRQGDAATRTLAQGIFDAFCRDMEHNLREMGISDPGVPRQMQKIGEAFYGRARAYDAALAECGEDALTQALARNVYAGAPEPEVAAVRFAAYVRQAVVALAAQSVEELARGVVRFPEPAVTLARAAE